MSLQPIANRRAVRRRAPLPVAVAALAGLPAFLPFLFLAGLAFACLPARANAAFRLGAGLFGIYGAPVQQESLRPGPLFGAKVRAHLVGPLGLEGTYSIWQEGDLVTGEDEAEQVTPGATQDAMSVNAVLGSGGATGLGVYLTGGLGRYTRTREDLPDEEETGVNGGVGVEVRTQSGLAIELGGRMHAVLRDGGSARKFAAFLAGVNYYFVR